MKMLKLSYLLVGAALTLTSLASCEKETEESLPVEAQESETENIEKNYAPGLKPAIRYYEGGPYTSYNYKIGTAGAAAGTSQGKRFRINTILSDRPIPSGTKQLFILQRKDRKDFLMTTNFNEFNNLFRTGRWYDRTLGSFIQNPYNPTSRRYEKVYIHTRGGNGRVKLHRFYDAKGQSIHLFTTNYNEGRNRGYKYEGLVGYVYP